MFACCAFIPIGFLLLIAPIMAAGRGWRPFLWTAVVSLVLLGMFLVANLALNFFDLDEYGRMLPLFGLGYMVLFIAMGGVVLYAKYAEGEVPGKFCRVCGYDLRASPDRCPECGTPVKFDPDRF